MNEQSLDRDDSGVGKERRKKGPVSSQALLYSPSVKQASGSRDSSGSTSGCSPSAGAPISTVLPSDELVAFSFWKSIPQKSF